MAIITCPECGHHPLSDRAAACPKCGCPIGAGGTPASAATDEPLSTFEQRKAQLPPGANLCNWDEDPVFVSVDLERVDLLGIVGVIQDWCKGVGLSGGLAKRRLSPLGRLPHLKWLSIDTGDYDDEILLQISKLQTLERLDFQYLEGGRVTERGWLFLTKLSQLERLGLPVEMLPDAEYPYNASRELREEIKRCMPQTLVKP